jgi:hypothetical protein
MKTNCRHQEWLRYALIVINLIFSHCCERTINFRRRYYVNLLLLFIELNNFKTLKRMSIKIEYWVSSKLVETFYKPNIAIAKWFIKELKQSSNYKLGTFKLSNN